MPRVTGRVKFWKSDVNWGFIAPDDGSEEVFVHITGLAGQLTLLVKGQLVSYETEETRKGMKAVNVEVV